VLDAAGLDQDVNVFHLDVRAAERALEADPWIASATVTTDLPRTVVVEVAERRPAVIVGEEVLAGDATPLPGARTGGLPVVRAAVGDLDASDGAAAALAAAALDPGLRGRVRYVVIAIDGDLELRMDDGLTVRWGSGGDDEAKASSLAAFLSYTEEQGRRPIHIDVSVPAAPSARFAS
jgi:cell division septal protein FtsQ